MNTGGALAGGIGILMAGIFKSGVGLGGVFAAISAIFILAAIGLFVAYRYCVAGDVARAIQFDCRRCRGASRITVKRMADRGRHRWVGTFGTAQASRR
jgi:hypothetical protein